MGQTTDCESTFYADDRQSRLVVVARADGLFQFWIDCVYGEEDAPEPEAVGCWKSDVSGTFVSGLYDNAEAAFSAGRSHMNRADGPVIRSVSEPL